MIFESLWPVALFSAVPAVIILYLLRPRGKDYRISSTLLWDKLFRNQQSKTVLEKFIHNILMYLQILILILLVLALMSPYIRREGKRDKKHSSNSKRIESQKQGSIKYRGQLPTARAEKKLPFFVIQVKRYSTG